VSLLILILAFLVIFPVYLVCHMAWDDLQVWRHKRKRLSEIAAFYGA
jgi:hypothetical protein